MVLGPARAMCDSLEHLAGGLWLIARPYPDQMNSDEREELCRLSGAVHAVVLAGTSTEGAKRTLSLLSSSTSRCFRQTKLVIVSAAVAKGLENELSAWLLAQQGARTSVHQLGVDVVVDDNKPHAVGDSDQRYLERAAASCRVHDWRLLNLQHRITDARQRSSLSNGATPASHSSNASADDQPCMRPARAQAVFRRKPRPLAHLYSSVVIWSSDMHITPIADVKALLGELGVRFVDKSLSGHCHLKGTCATDLRVLTRDNAIELAPDVRRAFFDAYKADREMAEVDLIFVSYPFALMEAYMPFNKTLVVLSSTRYEHGRHEADRWAKLNRNAALVARSPHHVVGANNLYDFEYVRYFTGLRASDVLLIPNYCDYAGVRYTPSATVPGFVYGHTLGMGKDAFQQGFSQAVARAKSRVDVRDLRAVYPGVYKYADLVRHPAIVYPAPYQLSTMSAMEQYRMGLPLLFPTVRFAVELDRKYGVCEQRTWWRVLHGTRSAGSVLGRHADYDGTRFDPNDEMSEEAMQAWFAFADWYQWPHVILFDSWDDLVLKLETTDFASVSERMLAHNSNERVQLLEQWLDILDKAIEHRGGLAKAPVPQGSFTTAMNQIWGRGHWA